MGNKNKRNKVRPVEDALSAELELDHYEATLEAILIAHEMTIAALNDAAESYSTYLDD